MRDALTLGLANRGHAVQTYATGEDALGGIDPNCVDVVVLDWMLPGVSGLDVCRGLRRASQIPIVMITARSDDESIVRGLEAGSDDYIVKPAEPRVIEARIRAVLRRAAPPTPNSDSDRRAAFREGSFAIDFDAVTVRLDGRTLDLTPTEFRLLSALVQHRGSVLSRHQLLEQVWSYDHLGDSRLVDACVQRLRAKVETDPSRPRYVQTVRGFGYRFGPV